MAAVLTPYASYAERYSAAGWRGVLPLPARKKKSPPDDFTGDSGFYPTPNQVREWVRGRGDGNIGLRMNEDVIGIDVDAYGGKPGAETLADLVERLGPLPATWTSTSRDDGVSGIRFYRISHPTRLVGSLPGIEFIQRHHRYAVAAPSIHPDTGGTYRWISPDGEVGDFVPDVADLPLLPDAWLEHLKKDNKTSRQRQALSTGHEVAEAVDRAYGTAMRGLRQGTRHDSALVGATTLIRLENLDYPGAAETLGQLRSDFLSAVGDSRSTQESEGEWDRIVASAEDLVQSSPSIAPRWDGRRGGGGPDLDDLIGESLKGGKAKMPPAKKSPPAPWPDPTELPDAVTLAPIPSHVFPGWILDYARSLAAQNQVAEDLPTILALGSLAAVLNGHVQIEATDGWVEGVNVWTCVLAEAGGSKSPVAKAMQAPAREFERQTIAWAASDVARYEQRIALFEKKAKEADDAYLRDGDEDRASEARDIAQEARELNRPPAGEIFAGDITPEALVDLLAENNEHGAISDTEGTILSIVAGRYSKTTNAEFILKTWAGDHHDVRRKSGEKFRLHDPHLTVSLTVQPGRWARVLANEELVDVGFPERFMVSLAPRRVGTRKPDLRRQRIDADAAATYHDEFLRFAHRCSRWAVAARLYLDDDAIDAFDAMRNDHEPRMLEGGNLAPHAVFIAKLHASVLRTAALLHIAWGNDPGEHVTGTTMAMAVELGSYWLDHYVGPKVDGQALSDAHRIIAWAAEKGLSETTATEMNRGMRIFRDAGGSDRRSAALLLLEEYGWARQAGEWPLDTARQGARIDVGLHPWAADGANRVISDIGATSPPSVADSPKSTTESEPMVPVAPMPPIAKSDSSSSSEGIPDAVPQMSPGIGATDDDDPLGLGLDDAP